MEGVEHEVALLSKSASAEDSTSVARLVRSWGMLVDFLALGPAPELRACPYCGNVGMRAAKLCGHCWKKLKPVENGAAPAEVARQHAEQGLPP